MIKCLTGLYDPDEAEYAKVNGGIDFNDT
ncbi:hypothetical protein ACEQPO_27270 [Bacillus sp. SL00103]